MTYNFFLSKTSCQFCELSDLVFTPTLYGEILQCFCRPLQVEQLGTEGKVEEAQGVMKLVDQLKEERELASRNVSVMVLQMCYCTKTIKTCGNFSSLSSTQYQQ